MRTAVGILLCMGLVLCAGRAAADTYYRYHDKSTGRDVYVNRLEQVPQKYRSQAKIVLEVEGTPHESDEATSNESIPAPASAPSKPTAARDATDRFEREFRKALASPNVLREAPTVVSGLIDFKMATSGARSLDVAEKNHLARLLLTIFIATLVAGLAALVAWIVIIVTAVRDNRFWWALFIFVFSPLGYLYLFLHGGKDRLLFKLLCALGMLSPLLVFLVSGWRCYAWFEAVMRARGMQV